MLTRFKYIKELFILAWPIIFGHLGHMLIGAGDVFVSGRYSSELLAAMGVANAAFSIVYCFGIGFVLSISPVLSKKRGQGDTPEKYLYTALIYALVISSVAVLLTQLFVYVVPFLGVEPRLVPAIQDYLNWVKWSAFGFFIYLSLREFLQTFENVKFANVIALISAAINVILNFIFVFGWWGFPCMEIKGLALASLLVRFFMALSLLYYVRHSLKKTFYVSREIFVRFFKLGAPIGFSLLIEVMGFCVCTFLVARISTTQLAAHNIVLTIVSLTFMIPLAVSNAVGVKTGYAYGQKKLQLITQYAMAALIISVGFMGVAGVCLYLFSSTIIRCFTADSSLLVIGSKIIIIGALFQIFDGAQVTLAGILRGMQISKPTFYVMLISFWCVGLPVGYVLAFHHGLDVLGIWIGLAIALFCASTGLSGILVWALNKHIPKLQK